MCGIIGLITAEKGKNDASDRAAFIQQALIVDTVRGWDAAGLFGALKNKAARAAYIKRTGSGFNLQTIKEYNDLFSPDQLHEYKFLVGHNRSATQGGTGLEAAHPFQVDNITLVHNGSLHSTHTLPRTQAMCKAINDSHTLAYNLAEFEPEEVLPNINGPFAIVWHDAEDDSLNIARNNERPLHIAKAVKNDTIYFMSEGAMLYALDERIGIGLQQIVSLQPYYWLKFTPGKIKPVVKQFAKYEFRPQMRQAPHVNYHTEWQGSLAQNNTDLTPSTSHPKMEKIPRRRGGDAKIAASESVQFMLLEHDLYVEEVIDFKPQSAEELPGKTGRQYVVQGKLRRQPTDLSGPLAIMYNVSETIWGAYKDRVWTARPMGIKYTDDKTPIIICKFVKATSAGDDSVEYLNQKPFTIYFKSPELIRPNGEVKLYKGPHGSWLRFAEWKHATSKGCIQCARPIHPSKASEVNWVNEGSDPMCPKCVHDYNTTNPISPSEMN